MISREEFLKALDIIEKYHKQEQILKEKKQLLCSHSNIISEVSEWHRNGEPDRWKTYCKDCDKVIND